MLYVTLLEKIVEEIAINLLKKNKATAVPIILKILIKKRPSNALEFVESLDTYQQIEQLK